MAKKKIIKVRDAVAVYNALRAINASKLPANATGNFIGIIRATRALKAIATAQADFERDAAERLRPADFDSLMERRAVYSSLAPAEQRQITEKLMAYENAFGECIRPELDKNVEIEAFEAFDEATLTNIASASENMTLETLLLVHEVCS